MASAQEYYEQAKLIDIRIKSSREELARLKDLVCNLSAVGYEDHPGKKTRNIEAPFIKSLERISEFETRLEKQINTMVSLREQIMDTIEKLPDEKEKTVLDLRYLKNLQFEDISKETGMCIASVYKYHSNGLRDTKLPADTIWIYTKN